MLTLYHSPLSGHAHRVLAMLSVLGLPYRAVEVDLAAGEQRAPAFLALNPLGEVPVLTDGEVTLRESTAALVYLAKRYDPSGRWLPGEAVQAAQVQAWLATSSKDLYEGPCQARLSAVFNLPFDQTRAKARAERLFQRLFEPHLARQAWLVGNQPTIADIANYSYIAVAPEGGIDLQQFPNVIAWLRRVEKLEGFVKMPKAATVLA